MIALSIVFVLVIIVIAYWLGYDDARLAERERDNLRRLDNVRLDVKALQKAWRDCKKVKE